MAPSASTFKQDLPPEGGYAQINWRRIPAKSYLNASKLFAGFTATTLLGFYVYSFTFKEVKRQFLEDNDAKLAIEPLLQAERDRTMLKQLRRNRDDEEKLMKNVPGWENGTYYGEPIFKTIPKDTWVDPHVNEVYVHTNQKKMHYDRNIQLRQ